MVEVVLSVASCQFGGGERREERREEEEEKPPRKKRIKQEERRGEMRLHRFGSSPLLLLFFCALPIFFFFPSLASAPLLPLLSLLCRRLSSLFGRNLFLLLSRNLSEAFFRHAQLRSGTEEKREKRWRGRKEGEEGKGRIALFARAQARREEKRKISRFSRQFSGEGAGGRGRAPTDQGKPGHPDDLSPPHRVRHRRPVSESARKCAPSSLEAFAGRPVPISDPVRRPGGGHV